MTLVNKTFVIVDIEEIQKAELNIGGMTLLKKPKLDMYRIKAILKSYCEKTQQGLKLLEKLGHGDKLNELELQYIGYQEAFMTYIPVTQQTLEWNKYHVGGEINIAYFPTNVWITAHTDGEPDNNDDKKRVEDGK